MSFSDWIFNFTTGDLYAGLYSPGIVGNYSLNLFSGVTGANRAITGYVVASPFTRGIEQGRILTVIKLIDNSNVLFYGGLYCMASSLTTDSIGNVYVLQIGKGTSNNVQIRKASSGGIVGTGTGGTQIGSSDSVSFTNIGDIVCLSIDWDAAHQTFYGGTHIKASFGVQPDFSDLSVFEEQVDSSSPLTSTVAEGMFLHQDSSSGSTCSILYDSTSILLAG